MMLIDPEENVSVPLVEVIAICVRTPPREIDPAETCMKLVVLRVKFPVEVQILDPINVITTDPLSLVPLIA